MSTVHTFIAPSFGGGSGKRGRDDDDGRGRRRPDRSKPIDKIGAADFAPNGRIRQLVLLLLQTANLGALPSNSLLTSGGVPKPLDSRTIAVRRWVEGHLNAANGLVAARYTELADAYVHVLRAIATAGYFDQLVAMLVEWLTNRAVDEANDEDN